MTLSLVVLVAVCVVCSLAQSVTAPPPRAFSFNATYQPGDQWTVAGGAGFGNGVLLLNAAQAKLVSPFAFFSQQVWVDSFVMNFTFRITRGPTAFGGLAFVVQAGSLKLTVPGDAGIGYGSTPGADNAGFSQCLALELDTAVDAGVDDGIDTCTTVPHLAVHSRNALSNSAVEKEANLAQQCYNTLADPHDQTHRLSVVYSQRVLRYYYDDIRTPLQTIQFDLVTSLALNNSLAWVGFSASTAGNSGGDGHEILQADFVYFSNLDATKSVVQGLPASVPAGQATTFVINAVDEYGHPYPFGGATIGATVQKATAPGQFQFTVNDFTNGTYSITFNDTLAAEDSLNITMNGVPVNGAPFALSVTPLQADPQRSVFGDDVTTGIAGTVYNLVISVFDVYGNPTPDAISIDGTTLSGDAGNITLSPPQNVSLGVWNVSYTPMLAGFYSWRIFINTVPVVTNLAQLHVYPGPPSAANSSALGLNSEFTAGNAQTFVLTVFDGFGNHLNASAATLSVQIMQGNTPLPLNQTVNDLDISYAFVTTEAGPLTPAIFVDGKNVGIGVPTTIAVDSAAISPAKSFIVYGGTPVSYAAGSEIDTALIGKDIYNNTLTTNGGATWSVNVSFNGAPTTTSYPAKENPASPGTWTVPWFPSVAGSYVMFASLNGVPVQNSGKYSVIVTSLTTPDVSRTQISGVGATTADQGSPARFWLVVEDKFGNVLTNQVNVNVTIYEGTGTPQNFVPTVVTYSAQNTSYVVQYTCSSSGIFTVQVTIDGTLCTSCPQIIRVGAFLTPGIIAAIVLGCVGGVGLIIGIILIIRRRKRVYQSI